MTVDRKQSRRCGFLLWLLAALAAGTGAAEEPRKGASGSEPEPMEIHVLDVVIVGTNQLQIGTNSVPLNLASNRIALYQGQIDAIAIHGQNGQAVTGEDRTSAMAKLASIGIPLVVVEEEGAYSWRTAGETNGTRSVKVSTDQFATLRRLWDGKKLPAKTDGGPSLQTTIDWDEASGAYALRRVEVGMFNKHVWLIHEQRESDEESGTVGIRIKKEW